MEDEEGRKEELEEALRIQRERAAALRPEDYGLEPGTAASDEEGEEEEELAGTLGHAADQVWPLLFSNPAP